MTELIDRCKELAYACNPAIFHALGLEIPLLEDAKAETLAAMIAWEVKGRKHVKNGEFTELAEDAHAIVLALSFIQPIHGEEQSSLQAKKFVAHRLINFLSEILRDIPDGRGGVRSVQGPE